MQNRKGQQDKTVQFLVRYVCRWMLPLHLFSSCLPRLGLALSQVSAAFRLGPKKRTRLRMEYRRTIPTFNHSVNNQTICVDVGKHWNIYEICWLSISALNPTSLISDSICLRYFFGSTRLYNLYVLANVRSLFMCFSCATILRQFTMMPGFWPISIVKVQSCPTQTILLCTHYLTWLEETRPC